MKKTLSLAFAFLLSLSLVGCNQSGEGGDDGTYPKYDEDAVVFHYQRTDGNYDAWALWIWRVGADGAEYQFNGTDSFGAVAAYPLSTFGDTTVDDGLGFIVKSKGDWSAKDVDSDRFVEFEKFTKDDEGMYHVYLCQGDANIYADSTLTIIDSIETAKFTSYVEIEIKTSNPFTSYKLYENDAVIAEANVDATSSLKITLPGGKEASFDNAYRIEVTFKDSGETLSSVISVSSLYSTDEFSESYNYDGELGAIYSKGSTTFRVWSPVSTKITLKIYDNGTPTSLDPINGSDVATTYEMSKGEKGVFEKTVSGDLSGKYYTFVVTNATYSEKEVVDPYAYSTGVNGLRGMVVDFDSTDPAGWDEISPHPYDRKELTVYETHISDITSSDTWGGTPANAKIFKGAYETGTTYTKGGVTVKTGFDHIKELGVNAVQIIPIFDQYNDETNMTFNWGYNPVNYNTLEGGYSSNPYDGYTRIKEFKELVMAYNKAGINIIMDVVYNHVNGAAGSQFDVLMPGYYFRYMANGSLSNGSGCGNETASEMYMYRKFMIDSTEFWASEYKLGGFRFDLMGLHDITTMNQIVNNLYKLNSSICVYGEPWTGGTTTLASSLQAIQANATRFVGFGQFNDNGRDGLIKGGLSAASEKGWVTNNTSSSGDWGRVKLMIQGSTNALITDPNKTTNYATCHDNYTLYDRIKAAGISDETVVKKMAMLANSVVLTSQATSFFLAGEEFLRTKGGNSNSYNASYEVNELDYELKVDNYDMFQNYQKLISFKQNVTGLHLNYPENTQLVVNNNDNNSTFEYTVYDKTTGRECLIIHSNGYQAQRITKDLSGYSLYLSTIDQNKTLSSATLIEPYETIICYK